MKNIPLVFALLVFLSGCGDSNDKFTNVFGPILPSGTEAEKVDQELGGELWLRFSLTSVEFNKWKLTVEDYGYSPWRKIPNKFHYTYGNFFIEGSDIDEVFLAENYPNGKGGNHLMLFYRPSTERLEAIFFRN